MTVKIKTGEEFLGIGLYGPLRISHTGDFDVKAGRELVAESVLAILSTNARFSSRGFFVSGERFMRDEFGTQTKILRHDNVDENLIALAEALYVDAIERWERRAVVKNIQSKTIGESLETMITIALIGTNDIANLVVIRDVNGRVTVAIK